MNTSNFGFLEKEYPLLYNLGKASEVNLYQDAATSLFKLRQFGEYMTEQIFDTYGMDLPEQNTFQNRVFILRNQNILPSNTVDYFTILRHKGNNAVHNFKASEEEAKASLFAAFKLAKWFYESYSVKNKDITSIRFTLPKQEDKTVDISLLESELQSVKKQYEALLATTKVISNEQKAQFTSRAKKSATNLDLNEAQTRILIDEQLRKAGWECDTINLNYKSKKVIPQKGKNIAIAEWPCAGKWADYALFIGEELFAIVEAKKYSQDISSNLDQAKLYAELVQPNDNCTTIGNWDKYNVPFLFATNGRSYIEQLKTKSGVWFLDVRNPYNTPSSINNFYSPEGLQELYNRDIDSANQKLKDSDYDYLSATNGLSLRNYQIEAIKAVERKLLNDAINNDKRALLVMATGTGKTRTVGGLIYRLIKANRFKRILFLTDRTLLAEQARDSISDNKIEDLQTFTSIYKIGNLDLKRPDYETRP